jgi:hypothetical protein
MITIFGDVCISSAKKLAFFLKHNVTIQGFEKLGKRHFCAYFFGEKNFKIITSVLGA